MCPCSARLGEKQLGCQAGKCLNCPGQGMESSCPEPVLLCRLVATAEPAHVPCTRPRQPPLALRKGHQGHRGQALGQRHIPGPGAAGRDQHPPSGQCLEHPACPGMGGVPWHNCPLARMSPGTDVPLHTCLAAAASHLLGIAHPEGDGVEMDEAASLGLKGRENGAESCCCCL